MSALLDPYEAAYVISPGDSADQPRRTRAVYVGGAGHMHVVLVSNIEVTFSGLLAGNVYPLQVEKVFETGTTATAILGLY